MSLRLLLCASATTVLHAIGQQGNSPIISGLPPDEYIDVTGDGRADLLLTSRAIHISDPQQPGFLGLYKLGVRTLSGNAVLMWNTPSNLRWYTLEDSARLDTGLIAARIHFKQLSWTDEDHPTEFWLLERPFGPAIGKDQDGWYGTGEQYEGTLVLRSANERGTSVAAFKFELPYPYGRVVIKVKEVVRVPNGFGDEGDPVPIKPKVVYEHDFGHEASEPQVMVPPGLPPDERVDIAGDEANDVVLTGYKEHAHGVGDPGYCVRGVSPLPGVSFLKQRERWGGLGFFRLREQEVLTPEHLANGLKAGSLFWVSPELESVFVPVLRHPFGLSDEPQEWSMVDAPDVGGLVFRASYYGHTTIIGVLEVSASVPGGELGVRAQTWVEEGKVLQVR